MKASFFAIPAFIAGAFAGPIARDAASDVNTLVANLQQTVLARDASINSTVAQMNAASTAEQNATAVASIRQDLAAISSSFAAAKQAVPAQENKGLLGTGLLARQVPVEMAIPQLMITLDDLFATVKLLLPVVGPGALSPILDNLNATVDSLLVALTPLLGGLLNGLLTGVGTLLASLLANPVPSAPGAPGAPSIPGLPSLPGLGA